ncbi:MAG: hypothetical protein H7Z74_15170 [Anaerolineae bacterium]|nr:hypothetical protein [Gemmatimonadaceae bacterium]
MTVGDWLSSRLGFAPPALAGQVRAALDADMLRGVEELPEICVSKGERLLRDLLLKAPDARERAGELLLVDALVTYAFEAAIENVQTLDDRARLAIERLSAVAAGMPR